jgi:hypothetical protein
MIQDTNIYQKNTGRIKHSLKFKTFVRSNNIARRLSFICPTAKSNCTHLALVLAKKGIIRRHNCLILLHILVLERSVKIVLFRDFNGIS